VCEGLVDVIEHHALGGVISFDGLQTGDVGKKGGSREAAQGHHRVVALGQLSQSNRITLVVNDLEIGDQRPDLWYRSGLARRPRCLGESEIRLKRCGDDEEQPNRPTSHVELH